MKHKIEIETIKEHILRLRDADCASCIYHHLLQGLHPSELDQQLICLCSRHILKRKARNGERVTCPYLTRKEDKV